MRFTLKYTATTGTAPQSTIGQSSTFAPVPELTPFPLTGKFRCRIVGYEFVTNGLHDVRLMRVVSRNLANPLQPNALLFFVPSGCRQNNIEQNVARAFSETGWWEVELHNGMDLIVYPADEILPGSLIPAFTFLLHLELERSGSGIDLVKK